jgi:hypothetical protein
MPSDPEYLRNLKQYARVQIGTIQESAEIVKDLRNESDRGAIILAATSIEDSLETALGMRMQALETDSKARTAIFGAEGTLSTYSDKTLLAYALGIIDRKGKKDIDLVRHIRNACAHSRQPLSLSMQVLTDAVKAAMGEELVAEAKDDRGLTLKAGFIVHCMILSHYVLTGTRSTPLEVLKDALKKQKEKS